MSYSYVEDFLDLPVLDIDELVVSMRQLKELVSFLVFHYIHIYIYIYMYMLQKTSKLMKPSCQVCRRKYVLFSFSS